MANFPSLLALLLLLLHLSSALNQEGLLLLDLKRTLDDPTGALSGWNERDPTPCSWPGISCDSTPAVTSVNLTNFSLVGPFPSALCRLPSLSSLSLAFNYLNSTLPSSLLLPCPPSLTHLDLSFNNLVGPIPPSLASSLPSLRRLFLFNNLLNSTVPDHLSNLTTLTELSLAYNPFTPSPIPPSFSNLSSLETLWLADCALVGPIPESLGKLSKLTDFDVSGNFLTGRIPASLTNLSSAVQIELYNNSLSGPIPFGFAGIAPLRRIDASMNHLSGPLPADIFDIKLLDSLHLYQNQLSGRIPPSVSKPTGLIELKLFQNKLTGTLPADLGKNSPLAVLDLSDNLLSEEIPASICDRGDLEELMLLNNFFSGRLPDGLARCRTLRRVRLSNNRLTGEVPAGLWGLPHVGLLELSDNSLSGGISPVISGAANLSSLLLSQNQFTGPIPSEIGSLSRLYEFSAAGNRLTGTIPASLGNLGELGRLDLHNNSLSGELLRGVQSWKKLTQLDLADNDFTGGIPPELGDLAVLNYLDLSDNLLTGNVPIQLQNLRLNQLNLSNNQLSGSLPPLYASDAYRNGFLGNPGLCGDIAGLCRSSEDESRSHKGLAWVLRSIFMLAALVLVVGVAWFYWRYRNFKKAKRGFDKSKWMLTSFHKLGFSEYEILDCLDEDNVIGQGASGKVYKAVLSNGEAVAVKKLWSSASKKNKGGGDEENVANEVGVDDAFESEVATLGKIRHKNIVKLFCSCSHKDCKLLVYEYMPNGSLGDLLHSSKGSLLDWPTRYKIALDAAEGLSYLHHDCVPPIVHRDVKSNNILLNAEFGASVSDFGVAKAVELIGKGPKSMSVIAGSTGYIAPEYAYTLRVNEKSDIYSFGVVILELVTGKLPVDPEFGEKDLVKWVCATLDQKGVEHVFDPKLDSAGFREEMNKVLSIGLLCTSSLPINRPSMRRVVKMLQEVGSFHHNRHKDGKLSPYYYEYEEDGSDQRSAV